MSVLYECVVRHTRSLPWKHSFAYRDYQWLEDVTGRSGLEQEDLPDGQILRLAHRKVLGLVFNPLTLYWCHRRDGTLDRVVAEVHNTYGQRHFYELRTDERDLAETDKVFYVSPFYEVKDRYRMHLPEPDARLAVTIRLRRDFVATVRGRAVPATAWRRLRAALATLLVVVRIRKQGIALYLRGLPVVPRKPVVPSKPREREGVR